MKNLINKFNIYLIHINGGLILKRFGLEYLRDIYNKMKISKKNLPIAVYTKHLQLDK